MKEMMKLKKCFTINQNRTKEEIRSYYPLFEKKMYQAVEIFYPYMNGFTQLREYTEEIKALKQSFPDLELVCHLPHGLYNGLSMEEHLDSGSLEIMMAACRFAHQFGIKKCTVHLGRVNKEKSREESIELVTPVLQALCDYALKFDQDIMIENMPLDTELGYAPLELLTIFEKVNRKNIKFIFDTGHAHVSDYEDTSYLYLLKDYLMHIHYSDNDSTKDAHARIGTGNIDFDAHFKALRDICYHELHCMEVIYHDANDLAKYVEDFIFYEEKYEK